MILFIALMLSFVLIYVVQARIFSAHATKRLHYSVRCGEEEVFAGEDFYLYEEISNEKALPLPYIKINTELPPGLQFRLTELRSGAVKESFDGTVQSVFVMHGYQRITRRWRVTTVRRGVYTIGGGVLISNDLFGHGTQSIRTDALPESGKPAEIVVLPRPVDLRRCFAAAQTETGDVPVSQSLLTDPVRRFGTREYTPLDPMNRINWCSTAVHGRLMVNVEEHAARFRFNILLHMNSRDIELHPDTPSVPGAVEQCITVAASLLDRVAKDNIPVRLFLNTPPDTLAACGVQPVGEDGAERLISAAGPYEGRGAMIGALRMLAAVRMQISCPADVLLDAVAAHPSLYCSGGNLIFITPYLSARMMLFDTAMRQAGYRVIFYVTSFFRDVADIPPQAEIYYALPGAEGGLGYDGE